jgi:hypothetical protein
VKQAAEQAAGYAEAGADLVIVNLPVPPAPSVLAPLAEALSPLA